MPIPTATAAPSADNVDGPVVTVETRRRVVRRAAACAVVAFLAACSLYASWHGVGRGIGDVLGCMFVDNGCGDSGALRFTAHRGVDDVDTWPALILFALAGLATWAALTGSRRLQKRAGVCAIVTSLLLGPYVLIAANVFAHFVTETVSLGGDYAFLALMLATLVVGIVNVRDPSPDVGLPRAKARIRPWLLPRS